MSTPFIRHNVIFMPLFFVGVFLLGQIELDEQNARHNTEKLVQQSVPSVVTKQHLENDRKTSSEAVRSNLVAGIRMVSI